MLKILVFLYRQEPLNLENSYIKLLEEQKAFRLQYSATSIICDSSAIKADYFLLCSYLEHLDNTEELN